jgi:hypothetical protein
MKKLLFLLAFFCAFLYSQNAYAYDWYLRGGFNSWQSQDTYKLSSTETDVYTLELSITSSNISTFNSSDTHEFKVYTNYSNADHASYGLNRLNRRKCLCCIRDSISSVIF